MALTRRWVVVGILLSVMFVPAVLATTDTIGDVGDYNNWGATNDRASPIVASASGVLQTVGINMKTSGGTIVLGIYSNSSGVPTALLGNGTAQAEVTGWNEMYVGAINIVAGTTYWIAGSHSSTTQHYSGTVALTRQNTIAGYDGTLPDPFGATTSAGATMMARMTYAASGGGPNLTISNCSTLNQTGSTYNLTADISNSDSATCMNIINNNIVLDCQGHTIDGIDAAGSHGIGITRASANNTNVTVKNCILTDWEGGIYGYYNSNNTYANTTASSNGDAVINYYTINSTISNITASSSGESIYFSYGFNNIVSNITVSGGAYGIYTESTSNNIFSNITTSGSSQCGMWFGSTSNYNTISNITASSNTQCGIFLTDSSNNTVSNITVSSSNYGIRLSNSFNNTITDGSIASSTTSDYYLISAGTTNNFTNTGFTASRKIKFGDTTSWFNYRNVTNGLWLKTNISAAGTITRTLKNWTQTNMSWQDSIDGGTATARFNLTGLQANTQYQIFNFSVLAYTITTDANGALSFTVDLNTTARTIQASKPEPTALTINSPTNTTYNYSAVKFNGSVNVISNISYSIDGGGNLTACLICKAFENFTAVADGAHVVKIYANLSTNGTATDNKTVYFSTDTAPPYITIVNPSGTYAQNATIPLNYSTNDTTSAVSKCWYSLNSASNISLTNCTNTTLTITQAGTHSVAVFANDTLNNINGTSRIFIYDPFENFTANGSIDGEQISSFQLLVMETSGSYGTTNGTIPVPLSAIGYGSRTLRFISSGYNTTDFTRTFDNGTLQTQNYTLFPASMNISVFDEGQAALGIFANITFNITITNTTVSTTWYNQSTFFKRTNETPTGSVTADISSAGYVSRRYYFGIDNNAANKFTAYLLQSTDALLVRFHVQNSAGSPISGASVNASRFISSSWAIMSEQLTDESGTAAMYLYPFATYTIAAGKAGYTDKSVTIQPSSTDYMITLQSGGGAEPYNSATTNVTVLFTPISTSINASLIEFVCQVNSSDNSLQYVNLSIVHYNGTIWYENVTTIASSIRLNASVNLTAENNTNVTAVCSFKRTGFDWVRYSRTYYIYNMQGGSFGEAAAAATALYSRMTLGLISIIITAIVAGGIGGIGRNTLAGAFAGLIALGIFTFMFNWFDWQVYILICAVFGAIMYLRSGV